MTTALHQNCARAGIGRETIPQGVVIAAILHVGDVATAMERLRSASTGETRLANEMGSMASDSDKAAAGTNSLLTALCLNEGRFEELGRLPPSIESMLRPIAL